MNINHLAVTTCITVASLTSAHALDSNAAVSTGENTQNSIAVSPGSDFVYSNFDISNNYATDAASGGRGINAEEASSVTIDNDFGIRNNITIHGINGDGVRLIKTGQSSIYNTNINLMGGGNNSMGIYVQNSTHVSIGNITVNLHDNNGKGGTGVGLGASTYSSISNSNDGNTVVINSTSSSAISSALFAYGDGSINLHNARINVNKTGSYGGILDAESNGRISLTNSVIKSSAGNTLVFSNGSHTSVVLNKVNLSNAKNQIVKHSYGSLDFSLTNGTNLDGVVQCDPNYQGSINMTISSGASWNVTENSDLGGGSLTLDASSTIRFASTGNLNDFTNLNAAAVTLASGSIIQLDTNASTFWRGHTIMLFTGLEDGYVNDGAIIVSADGWGLTYQDLGNGRVHISGHTFSLIPEPATATLGLIGLAALASRRRRTN